METENIDGLEETLNSNDESIIKEKKDKKNKKDSKTDELSKEIELLKLEVASQMDKAARANAELVNYKKRKDEEVAINNKYANKGILLEILSTVDNFESAIKMEDNDTSNESRFAEGYRLIYNQLLEILKNNNVEEVNALGEKFDPIYHQAVMTREELNKDDNTVIEVFQKGYMYKDRLLRPSMVVVNSLIAKGKENNE